MIVRHVAALVSALVAVAAAPGRADVVTDWNQTTIQVGGPALTRTLAMVHLAMFDAVNSVEPRYEPYASQEEVTAPTSPEAAAVGAAYGVLSRQFGASATPHRASFSSACTATAGSPWRKPRRTATSAASRSPW
jgi:hypothetical protein